MKGFAFLALALAGACWGLGFPLGKLALKETDAPDMVLLRFAVATLASLPFAMRTREARALFRSVPVIAAGVLYGAATLVQFEALARTSVTLSALLVGAMPALVAICAPFTGEKVSRLSWLGVVGATAGALLISGKPGSAGTAVGIALAVCALLGLVAWQLVLRHAPRVTPIMAIPAVTMIVATATILPIALALHGAPSLALSSLTWSAIIGQGIVSTFLAAAAWQFGASRVQSTTAGVFINIEPLIGAALGVSLFGDHLTLGLATGGSLIIAGSFAVILGETPPVKRSELAT